MQFNQQNSIYQQIADQMCDLIASEKWVAGEKIPSVREMAVNMGVNPNTISRSYQRLTNAMIIENRRGVGFFVTTQARQKIIDEMKEQFIVEQIPQFFDRMNKLGISLTELIPRYEEYIENIKE